MINIDSALKTIYKNDRFPMSTVAHLKDMETSFSSIGLIIAGEQFADDKGEFELSEGICRDSDLKFGKCNSAQVKFTVADVVDDIVGKEFYLKQTVDDMYEMPFGYFTVDTCPKQDDLRFKDITAYDRMQRVNTDVSAWYRALTLPMSLAAFRTSFLTYVGLDEDISNLPLPNDNMVVERTIDAEELPGQEVIERIEEVNGSFGVINTEGKFSHIVLKPVRGMYPSNALYPSASLYPVPETDTTYNQPDLLDETVSIEMREGIRFEEYTVPEIDKLIIRGEEDDIGTIVGSGSNAYIIEGNFLLFGKSANELEVIAYNAFGHMAKRPYRPFVCSQIGLPYVKPGDMLKFEQDDPVVGYILNRTLKGVQVIRDEYASPGSRKRAQNTSQNNEIIKLKYRTNKLRVDVDGVSVELSDLSDNVETSFSVVHGEIELKVAKAEVIASINLTSEAATIKASKINFNGFATFDVDGNLTTIDGSVLKTGTVVADTVRADWVYANSIDASQITAGTISGDIINGGTINGTSFHQTGTAYTTDISNGSIDTGLINLYQNYGTYWRRTQITAGDIVLRNSSGNYLVGLSDSGLAMTVDGVTKGAFSPDGYILCKNVSCDTINDYTPVNSNNISSYAAPINHTHSQLWNGSNYGYLVYDGSFVSNVGSSIGNAFQRWSTAYLVTAPNVSSDRNAKYNIEELPEIYKTMICKLKPVRYKYNDNTSDRYHTGFISQDVEDLISELGLSSKDLAAFVKSPIYSAMSDDGVYDISSDIVGYNYSLRYEEFISPAIAVIQEQNNKIIDLEARLKSIEALSCKNY